MPLVTVLSVEEQREKQASKQDAHFAPAQSAVSSVSTAAATSTPTAAATTIMVVVIIILRAPLLVLLLLLDLGEDVGRGDVEEGAPAEEEAQRQGEAGVGEEVGGQQRVGEEGCQGSARREDR